jgi:ribosomal protein L29
MSTSSNYKEMSLEQLNEELTSLRNELFQLKFKHKVSPVANTASFKKIRLAIAPARDRIVGRRALVKKLKNIKKAKSLRLKRRHSF